MIEIIERHMDGGDQHEHIAEVKYISSDGKEIKRATRQAMVEWLDASDSNTAIVRSKSNSADYAYVGVVHRDSAPDYIKTFADRTWTNNLLALDVY